MSYVPIQGLALPTPFPILEVEEFSFKQLALYSILATDTIVNPHFFRKWQILKGGASPVNNLATAFNVTMAIMKRDSGADQLNFGLITSPDNATWSTFAVVNSSDASETQKNVNLGNNTFPSTITHFAFAAWSGDGITLGTVRNMRASMLLSLAFGYTVTRLI